MRTGAFDERRSPCRPIRNRRHALPDRPNLRHLKDQAKDLVKAGAARSIADAQFRIARLCGFPSWPKSRRMSNHSTRSESRSRRSISRICPGPANTARSSCPFRRARCMARVVLIARACSPEAMDPFRRFTSGMSNQDLRACLRIFEGHSDTIRSVAWSHDHRHARQPRTSPGFRNASPCASTSADSTVLL